jgi:predicted enzyme related to lactoylglutathione lyase
MPRPVHFDLTAENPERAVAFYGDVFGWQFQKWDGGGPFEYWLITTGQNGEPGIDGGLSRRQESSGGITNTISVPSLDEYIQRITQAGGKVVAPRMAIPTVGWFAAFSDPEGNKFALMESDPHAS